MSEETPKDEEALAPYIIEGARSSRSRCKTCRRKIDKGNLRMGILIEGPFGTGYLWHHLRCAARRSFEQVEEAYEQEAWRQAKEPPGKLPSLESLRKLGTEATRRKQEKRELPYAEVAPTGRSKCKHCGEAIAEGSLRVILAREVEFGRQVRVGPINVHPGCVAPELAREDCATEAEGLEEALSGNSPQLSAAQREALWSEIGLD